MILFLIAQEASPTPAPEQVELVLSPEFAELVAHMLKFFAYQVVLWLISGFFRKV